MESVFKKYYADPVFRERHLARMREKINCVECGASFCRSGLTKHKKTIKHQTTVNARIPIVNVDVVAAVAQ